MAQKMSKARKNFRKALFVLAGISAVFFAGMITLRMNKSAHWYVVRNYQSEIFQADVYKHQLQAKLQNDDERMRTALSLVQKGVFSRVYSESGTLMLKELADDGHPPSQVSYGDILLRTASILDKDTQTIIPDHQKQMKARYYYHLAATEDYPPALLRLGPPTQ